MGSLTLPPSGRIYVDSDIVIYSVEHHPKYWKHLEDVWLRSEAGQFEIVSSEFVLLETLSGPLKKMSSVLVETYDRFLSSPDYRLVPIDRSVLRKAAELRAQFDLKSPDAIHAATALLSKCLIFLTNDEDFRRVHGLGVTILRDVSV